MGANNIGVGWTPERDALLRAAWEAGDTAKKIAADMGGFGHTVDGGRNSVISRVHRLGLSKRAEGNPRLDSEERDRRLAARVKVSTARRTARRAGVDYVEPSVSTYVPRGPKPEYVPTAGISFDDLLMLRSSASNQCRYPVSGDHGSNYMYCGSETLQGESYCGHCRDICFQPKQRAAELTEAQREMRQEQGRTAGYSSIKQRGLVMGRFAAAATSPIHPSEALI